MESFDLKINKEVFRSTNAQWNQLMLNAPWSVGFVSSLIESQPFANKEAWQQFYFDSGDQRAALLRNTTKYEQQQLNDLSLAKSYKSLSPTLYNLNVNYGRTKKELRHKAHILQKAMHHKGTAITLRECIHCVHHRVIAETWNGIVLRERQTIQYLSKILPLTFKKTDGTFDHQYAVDYEVFKGTKLIAAIQIKPKSYCYDTHYICKAKKANRQKNKQYTILFGVPVFDVIANQQGIIDNTTIIQDLRRCILR